MKINQKIEFLISRVLLFEVKSLIRSILNEILQKQISRKNNLSKELVREIKKITFLDIGFEYIEFKGLHRLKRKNLNNYG